MRRIILNIIGKDFEVDLEGLDSSHYSILVNGTKYEAQIQDETDAKIHIAVEGNLYLVELPKKPDSGGMEAKVNNRKRILTSSNILGSKPIGSSKTRISDTSLGSVPDHTISTHSKASGAEEGILAPMPGKVVMVTKNVGDDVKVGDVVLILEAMKMENEITSNMDGKITEVRVREGDSVDAQDVLVVVG
jgi:biotin carboxyl carrier protein